MSRPDPELESLIAQARSDARAEVLARLSARFVEELMAEADELLGRGSAEALSLVGVVPSDSALEGVSCGCVKALVAKLDPGALEDPGELERRVRLHSETLSQALGSSAVVPIRFGTLFARPEDVTAWLERNEAALAEELARLRDTAEWAVTMAGARQPEVDPITTGRYLERRLAAGEEAAGRARLFRERAEAWHERLAVHAEAAALSAATERLDAAYLVRRERQQAFDNAVAELQAELGGEVELRLSGPWPPFSFVTEGLR